MIWEKYLCLFGEPQWAVVGDTFPVGCKFSDKIVHPEFFELNPDSKNPNYNTPLGIYTQNCGLDKVKMSWGHDEYLYQILKDYLPKTCLVYDPLSFILCSTQGRGLQSPDE